MSPHAIPHLDSSTREYCGDENKEIANKWSSLQFKLFCTLSLSPDISNLISEILFLTQTPYSLKGVLLTFLRFECPSLT